MKEFYLWFKLLAFDIDRNSEWFGVELQIGAIQINSFCGCLLNIGYDSIAPFNYDFLYIRGIIKAINWKGLNRQAFWRKKK